MRACVRACLFANLLSPVSMPHCFILSEALTILILRSSAFFITSSASSSVISSFSHSLDCNSVTSACRQHRHEDTRYAKRPAGGSKHITCGFFALPADVGHLEFLNLGHLGRDVDPAQNTTPPVKISAKEGAPPARQAAASGVDSHLVSSSSFSPSWLSWSSSSFFCTSTPSGSYRTSLTHELGR